MDTSLQNRINLLGALLIGFVLLSLPLFSQVREDSVASVKEAPNTLLAKFGRSMAQQFSPKQGLVVEDAWYDEAKRNNPECGPSCDPDGDPDGDGRTNRQELEDGTNPMCNEEEYGHAYCEGVDDQYNVTNPNNTTSTKRLEKTLYSHTWSGGFVSPADTTFETGLNFDHFVVYWNASYDERGYSVRMDFRGDGTNVWSDSRSASTLPAQGSNPPQQTQVTRPVNGTYDLSYQVMNSQLPAVQDNLRIEIHVVGVIEPRQVES